jgi:predicted nucleotidyltransferase component of viral defense system
MVFEFTPETDVQALKLKVEINTREHESYLGSRSYPLVVDTDWYQGQAEIASFEPEELFGTKLRALLQRRKNRDLFDLHQGLDQLELDPDRLVACFNHYLALEGKSITRAMAEQRMLERLARNLTEDVAPLLPVGIRFAEDDAIRAFEQIWTELIGRIRGESWKLTGDVLGQLRREKYPGLLSP